MNCTARWSLLEIVAVGVRRKGPREREGTGQGASRQLARGGLVEAICLHWNGDAETRESTRRGGGPRVGQGEGRMRMRVTAQTQVMVGAGGR